ncbi:MAG: Uma2 family endonuclease [Waterburya sp.]
MTTIKISAFTDQISDRDLEKLCADNPESKFETTKEGKLIVMSPTGSESGRRNSDLLIQIGIWNRQTRLGEIFDSSTGFKLANGATRSPDVSWIERSRWNSLTKDLQRKFAPIDPDFVIELMSPTDDLDELRQKMAEYISCGVKLGWLINPDDKQVEIYRVGKDKEILNNPQSLFGEELMPNLIVDLAEIF